jgi:Spy/CpxP family protein refolding chaperone
MRNAALSGLFIAILSVHVPAVASASDDQAPSAQEEMRQSLEDLSHRLRQLFSRWGRYLSGRSSREERPLISIMLENREKLGLSTEQVKRLEQLKRDFQKESIRSDADIRIAQMDLDALLSAQKVDMAKVETKVREIEHLRANIRLARIRAIEQGKQQLSAEQRDKLEEILSGSPTARPKPQTEHGSPA